MIVIDLKLGCLDVFGSECILFWYYSWWKYFGFGFGNMQERVFFNVSFIVWFGFLVRGLQKSVVTTF